MILFLLQIYFNIFKEGFSSKKYDKKDVFSTKPDVLFSLWKIFPETQMEFIEQDFFSLSFPALRIVLRHIRSALQAIIAIRAQSDLKPVDK